MFSEGGTVLKEKYANAEDQTGLPSGAGEGEGVRQGSEHEARDREIFEDDGQLDSSAAQSADAMMEVAGILAGGNFDDLSEEDLAKIKNPALRAQLQGKILEAKQAAEIRAQDIAMRQQAWDRGDVICQIAGTKLNSRQVDNILRMMADPQQKAKLVDKFSKEQGISKPEAEKKLDQAGRTLEVVKKKELDPNAALTPQEQTDYDRRNDPKLAPAMKFLEEKEREMEMKGGPAEQKQVLNSSANGNVSVFSPVQQDLSNEPAIKTTVPLDRDFKKASNAEPPAEEPEAKVAPVVAATPAASTKAATASWG
jgi:hypothetical protein